MKPLRTLLTATLIAALPLVSAAAGKRSIHPSQEHVDLDVGVGTPVVLADQPNTAYVRVALTGFDLPTVGDRTPVNVAIVLDKSGSMNGDKMRQAKQAASLAISHLNDSDIVSIISYDDTVHVAMPATRASDKATIRAAINNINANGSTALFAGVSKGAHEVRKFISKNRVNRVILLSDGLANVGPSTPSELGNLGHSLGKEGVIVTTIGLGLGYNEDLMTRLAGNSDGNHYFVENPTELANIFNKEFGDILSVVAQDVHIHIDVPEGVRPLRVIGRDAEILGQSVRTDMGQLYSNQEKFVLLEVAVPPGKAGQNRRIANVEVTYANMHTQQRDHLSGKTGVRYSHSKKVVKRNVNKPVMGAAVKQIANEKSKRAVTLRDAGKVKEARQALTENADYYRANSSFLAPQEAAELESEAREEAAQVEDESLWNKLRKGLRSKQYSTEKQQKK